jgi:GNAT superfamily N-acetyltransferase
MNSPHQSLPPLTLTPELSPDEATVNAISSGLDRYNARFAPEADWSARYIVGRDGAGAIQAGVKYVITYDWLFVNWLWVADAYRKQGIGSRLLKGAEDDAREKGAHGAYLDTFTFQGPDFYPRHGYREFGRLENFPPGQTRFWLMKKL